MPVDIALVPCDQSAFILGTANYQHNIIEWEGNTVLPICFTYKGKQLDAGYVCSLSGLTLTPIARLMISHTDSFATAYDWYDTYISTEAMELLDIISACTEKDTQFKSELGMARADEAAQAILSPDAKVSFITADYETALSLVVIALTKQTQNPYPSIPSNTRELIQPDLDRLQLPDTPADEKKHIQNYLHVLTSIPWSKLIKSNVDPAHILEHLNKSHYALDEVKMGLADLVGLYSNSQQMPKTILLAGPPNGGKTSLVRSLAEAAQMKAVVIPMAGMSDVNNLMGFSRTYRDSQPGRIIKALISSKCMNPIIILDEIDKTTEAIQNQLLHILDPDHRDLFVDNYIGIPVDLSKCIFLATANDLTKIIEPLARRLLVYLLPAYTNTEREIMIRDHIFPKLTRKLSISNLKIDDLVIRELATSIRAGSVEDTLLRLVGRANTLRINTIDIKMLAGVGQSKGKAGNRVGF